MKAGARSSPLRTTLGDHRRPVDGMLPDHRAQRAAVRVNRAGSAAHQRVLHAKAREPAEVPIRGPELVNAVAQAQRRDAAS